MMRKLFVALLVGAVAVSLAAPAFAADLKFTGAYRIRFQFDDNLPCLSDKDGTGAGGGTDCSGHQFQTRVRPRFDVETEGGVRGVLRLEIGDVRFGGSNGTEVVTDSTPLADEPITYINAGKGLGGGSGADGANVETKWAYIDFPIPATPLRLRGGIQPFFTSKALLLDDDGSGLSVYGKLGEINTNLWWFRANSLNRSGSFAGQLAGDPFGVVPNSDADPRLGSAAGSEGTNARDVYGLDVSFTPMRDLTLGAYLVMDHDMETTDPATGESTAGFWFGAAAAGKVQNIRWDLDFVYGTKETPHPIDTATKVDQKGYMLDAGVGMAFPGTALDLELRGWWATGWDGKDTGDIDAFPVLYAGSGGHEPGTQVWGGGGAIDIDALADNPQNTWGIGLIARYTYSPTLKVAVNVHYIGVPEEGNPAAGEVSVIGDGFLVGVDGVGTEVGAKIDYTIARGLVFTLTAGYLSLAEDTIPGDVGVSFDDVIKVAGVVNYDF